MLTLQDPPIEQMPLHAQKIVKLSRKQKTSFFYKYSNVIYHLQWFIVITFIIGLVTSAPLDMNISNTLQTSVSLPSGTASSQTTLDSSEWPTHPRSIC